MSTAHDRAVLDKMLFNSETAPPPPPPPSTGHILIGKTATGSDLTTQDLESIQLRQRDAITCAETDPHQSLLILDSILKDYPNHPSTLNNRAQVKILLHNDKSGALQDIQCAIDSTTDSNILAAAYLQRASILYNDHLKNPDTAASEEYIAEQFRLSGLHGSPVGRAMAAKLNPMAKMCGEMVQQMMAVYKD